MNTIDTDFLDLTEDLIFRYNSGLREHHSLDGCSVCYAVLFLQRVLLFYKPVGVNDFFYTQLDDCGVLLSFCYGPGINIEFDFYGEVTVQEINGDGDVISTISYDYKTFKNKYRDELVQRVVNLLIFI